MIKQRFFEYRVMRTMGKSFIFGIVVASITWSISLYLYWTLLHNNDVVSKGEGSISVNSLDNDIRKNYDKSKHSSKNMYMDKVERYKKEKKYRKISRTLADELQPKVIDFSGEVKVSGQRICTKIFIFRLQMTLGW